MHDIIHWAIVIFCRKFWEKLQYLVVQNTETENISFVAWAQEPEDNDLLDTAKREVKQELNISLENYTLIPSTFRHEFTFWEKKKERVWKKASYQIFWADGKNIWDVHPTTELQSAVWMTQDEVINTLTFDDLKELFIKVVWEIEI